MSNDTALSDEELERLTAPKTKINLTELQAETTMTLSDRQNQGSLDSLRAVIGSADRSANALRQRRPGASRAAKEVAAKRATKQAGRVAGRGY